MDVEKEVAAQADVRVGEGGEGAGEGEGEGEEQGEEEVEEGEVGEGEEEEGEEAGGEEGEGAGAEGGEGTAGVNVEEEDEVEEGEVIGLTAKDAAAMDEAIRLAWMSDDFDDLMELVVSGHEEAKLQGMMSRMMMAAAQSSGGGGGDGGGGDGDGDGGDGVGGGGVGGEKGRMLRRILRRKRKESQLQEMFGGEEAKQKGGKRRRRRKGRGKGRTEEVEMLLSLGADKHMLPLTSSPPPSAWSLTTSPAPPFGLASSPSPFHPTGKRRTEEVEMLLSLGADVTLTSDEGSTALDWARKYGHEAGRAEEVEMLLSLGADVTLTSDEGSTALDWARMYGHEAVCRLLERHMEALGLGVPEEGEEVEEGEEGEERGMDEGDGMQEEKGERQGEVSKADATTDAVAAAAAAAGAAVAVPVSAEAARLAAQEQVALSLYQASVDHDEVDLALIHLLLTRICVNAAERPAALMSSSAFASKKAQQLLKQGEEKEGEEGEEEDELSSLIPTYSKEGREGGGAGEAGGAAAGDGGAGLNGPDCAILVFLPGWEEISRLRDRLLGSSVFGDPTRFLILPLHSKIPMPDQRKVFERLGRGVRKIVLTTNIAETALTIDDIVFVVDSGRLKEKSYDAHTNVSTLQVGGVGPGRGVKKIVLTTNFAETALAIDDVVFVVDSGRLKEKSYDAHTNVSTLQRKVFERPGRGVRKIVLTTNIAETALTIDDIVFVVDSGRLKEKSYDAHTNVSTLQEKSYDAHTNVSTLQVGGRGPGKGVVGGLMGGLTAFQTPQNAAREGRAEDGAAAVEAPLKGRGGGSVGSPKPLRASARAEQGGANQRCASTSFHTHNPILSLPSNAPSPPQAPEIKRSPLEELCLQIKILDPSLDIPLFLSKALEPPVPAAITNAVALLQDIGALDPHQSLTPLGAHLGALPLHPVTSKMLLHSILLDCLGPALTVAAASTYRDPFQMPIGLDQKLKAIAARHALGNSLGGYGDHLALIAAFDGWAEAKARGGARAADGFCRGNFLSPALHRGAEEGSGTAGGAGESGGSESIEESSRPLIVFDEIVRGEGNQTIRSCTVVRPLSLILIASEMVVAPLGPLKAGWEEDGDGEKEEGKGEREGEGEGEGKGEREGEGKGEGVEVRKRKRRQRSQRGEGESVHGEAEAVGEGSEAVQMELGKGEEGEGAGGNTRKEGEDEEERVEEEGEYVSGAEDEEGEEEEGPVVRPNPKSARERRRKLQEEVMSDPGREIVIVIDRWLRFRATAMLAAQLFCLRERLAACFATKVHDPRKPLPPLQALTLYTIASLLSFENYLLPPPTSDSAPAGDKSAPAGPRKGALVPGPQGPGFGAGFGGRFGRGGWGGGRGAGRGRGGFGVRGRGRGGAGFGRGGGRMGGGINTGF
ncbi:unnamed protein product [Closterium sp. Naga37s-1]|nr:unnamed protein product [Closterium sp. Naga37s-1]